MSLFDGRIGPSRACSAPVPALTAEGAKRQPLRDKCLALKDIPPKSDKLGGACDARCQEKLGQATADSGGLMALGWYPVCTDQGATSDDQGVSITKRQAVARCAATNLLLGTIQKPVSFGVWQSLPPAEGIITYPLPPWQFSCPRPNQVTFPIHRHRRPMMVGTASMHMTLAWEARSFSAINEK